MHGAGPVSLTLVAWKYKHTLLPPPPLIQRYANGYVFICFGGKADRINNNTILQPMRICQMFNRKSNRKIHEHLHSMRLAGAMLSGI